MSLTLAQIIGSLERLAPTCWAQPGDPVGLQLGRPTQEVTTVLVVMEVTRAVLTEARRLGAQLIITHHPLLFTPLAQLRTDTPHGGLLAGLLRAEISVYVAHTNLDCAPRVGPAAQLAARLALGASRPLLPLPESARLKLVTFLPAEDVPALREALAQAGAGAIGSYRECAFQVAGQGHFFAPDEATPVVGRAGERNLVPETRLEMVVPAAAQDAVVRALREVHPYEEPAFDLYPLVSLPSEAGLGRIGTLPAPLAIEDLARQVGAILGTPEVQMVGAGPVETVAVLPGSGRTAVQPALAADADVLVTGELGHHDAAEASAAGLASITAGHAESEALLLPALAAALREEFGESLQVAVAPVERLSRSLPV